MARLLRLLPALLVAGLAVGCPDDARPIALDGPDVFFGKDRLARILEVDMADRAAVLKEYEGQRITARFPITNVYKVSRNASPGALGSYLLNGLVHDVYRRVDVSYSVYFDDDAVLTHKVKQIAEVKAVVRSAEWEIRQADQTLLVKAVGESFTRLGD